MPLRPSPVGGGGAGANRLPIDAGWPRAAEDATRQKPLPGKQRRGPVGRSGCGVGRWPGAATGSCGRQTCARRGRSGVAEASASGARSIIFLRTSPVARYHRGVCDGGLILGAATGYQWPDVADFVTSWRRHAARSPLVLLVDASLTRSSRTRLCEAGVTLHRLRAPQATRSRVLRRWLRSRRLAPLRGFVARRLAGTAAARSAQVLRWRPLLAWHHHIACARYLHYLEVLSRAQPRPRHVLLSDTRDVLFQADPFERAPASGLLCALEARASTLLSEPCNRDWLDQAYGRAAWGHLGSCRVSCAGTTLGTRAAVVAYLTRMSAEIARLTPVLAGRPLDQALHNLLLHGGALGRVAFSEPGEGLLTTLHAEDPARFARDARGGLLDGGGRLIPVVHQHDRHPALAAELRRAALG